MTKLEKHDQESVERARKLLLEKFFGGANGDRLRKKEVVRQLLGTIIAVRNDGMSFQDIAKVFAEAGLELNEHTLRLYFYELKGQAEIAAHEKAHAEQVARTRAEIAGADLSRLSASALAAAKDEAIRKRGEKDLQSPPPQKPQAHAAPSAAPPQKAGKASGARPPKGGAPRLPTHASEGAIERAGEGWFPPPPIETAPAPTAKPADSGDGLGPTIDEAVQRGVGFVGVRPELRDNVVLLKDRVYWETGEAFDGALTKAQAHILRQVGRLVAPTTMTSSGDFVEMPNKL